MGTDKLRLSRWQAALAVMFLASALLTLTLIVGSAFPLAASDSDMTSRSGHGFWSGTILENVGIVVTRHVGRGSPSPASPIAPPAGPTSPQPRDVILVHPQQQLI